MMEYIVLTICFIGLIIGSIMDIRKREVADTLNYSLIFIGFGIHLLFAVIQKDISIFLESVFGFLFFFIIACLMFYTAQWGGGDSKMLMALGALLGLKIEWPLQKIIENPPFLLNFLIYVLLAGGVYGLIWSIALIFKNFTKFKANFTKFNSKKEIMLIKKIVLVVVTTAIISLIFINSFIYRFLALSISIIIIIAIYMYILTKALENTYMLKEVAPEMLTEGDWIAKDVKVNGKYICGPKDLGISKEQIETLKKLKHNGKIKKILIKEGIPFIPSFLIALIIALILKDYMLILIKNMII